MANDILPTLYGRQITLRNCGRFVHVSADFGSEYTTHAHLSSEMLYAGLTREQSRKPRDFRAAMNGYHFLDDFDLTALPLWFTVAVLTGPTLESGRTRVRDVHTFNSLLESAPGVQTNDRLPKYGTMETILPDQRFLTVALSPRSDLLSRFSMQQVFWMGKKRTMFQILGLGDIIPGIWEHGPCRTRAIQIGPPDVPLFEAMQVLAATQRYLVVEGALSDTTYLSLGAVEAIPRIAVKPLLQLAGS